MQIDYTKFEALEMKLAASRGVYDTALEEHRLLKRQIQDQHQVLFSRLLARTPLLPQSPREWLHRLDYQQMRDCGVHRPDVEFLAEQVERAGRLQATAERIGNEMAPLSSLVNRCRDYIETQRGALKLT